MRRNPSRIQPDLTKRGLEAIHFRVKPLFFLFPCCVVIFVGGNAYAQKPLAPLPPQKPVMELNTMDSAAPAEVVASAVAAVGKLGDEVVLGRFQIAVDRMNPMWKERAAKRMGGMEKLNDQLAGVARQMIQQGISMISFKPQGQPRAFEVSPGRKVESENGVEVETLVFNKWLVMVPTETKFRIIREGEPKPLVIDSIGFQVAISDKGKNDWTFIDGSGLSVNDLRGLFATLPQDLVLPPLSKKESR